MNLKTLTLSPQGAKKVIKGISELYKADFESNIKPLIPGEWACFVNEKKQIFYTGFVNPLVENNRPCAYIIENGKSSLSGIEIIKERIELALERRTVFPDYNDNARLVYGIEDSLPGLVVDSYSNILIIQINTAGMDLYRKEIETIFTDKFPQKQIYLLDNEKYRIGEMLPVFERPEIKENIEIKENDLDLSVSNENLQKVGYYYDHRENRRRMRELLKRLNIDKEKGMDLFCYVGSWGLNLLKAGCKSVQFVDQGNFANDIEKNLKQNGFENSGTFEREDVFKYLKNLKNKGETFNVICSDPPAFCKSKKEKQRAYEGYVKLHRSCLSLLDKKSLFIACSCTHYVDHSEFQKSVVEAAKLEKRNINLVDIGIQGIDHPIKTTEDKGSYLKYYAYIVE